MIVLAIRCKDRTENQLSDVAHHVNVHANVELPGSFETSPFPQRQKN